MEELDLDQEPPIDPEKSPDLTNWWDTTGESVEAATDMVEGLKAAGASDNLVSLLVMFIGLSMLLGVLRRSINRVVSTGADIVDREHSLSVEKRKKSARVGPYYIPPAPRAAPAKPEEST